MHDDFSEGETGTDKVSCTSVDRRELNSPHPALTRSQTLATGFTFQVSQLGTNSHQIGLYPSQDLEGSQSSSPSSLLIFCLALCVQTIDIIYMLLCQGITDANKPASNIPCKLRQDTLFSQILWRTKGIINKQWKFIMSNHVNIYSFVTKAGKWQCTPLSLCVKKTLHNKQKQAHKNKT